MILRTWDPRQTVQIGWKWGNNHFLNKDLVHHPLETTRFKKKNNHLSLKGCLGFQEVLQNHGGKHPSFPFSQPEFWKVKKLPVVSPAAGALSIAATIEVPMFFFFRFRTCFLFRGKFNKG